MIMSILFILSKEVRPRALSSLYRNFLSWTQENADYLDYKYKELTEKILENSFLRVSANLPREIMTDYLV